MAVAARTAEAGSAYAGGEMLVPPSPPGLALPRAIMAIRYREISCVKLAGIVKNRKRPVGYYIQHILATVAVFLSAAK